MIGDGLSANMPPRELRAILAHEIAHVLRSDVRNQLLVWIGLGSIWTYAWTAISVTFDLRGAVWAAGSGVGWTGVLMLWGRYSRRCELAADRLAGELMEAPADMRAALIRLAEITKVPPDRRSPTHPSLNDRLTSRGLS
jgi:heat shock protein HtpX